MLAPRWGTGTRGGSPPGVKPIPPPSKSSANGMMKLLHFEHIIVDCRSLSTSSLVWQIIVALNCLEVSKASYLKTPLDFNSWLKTFLHLVAVALAMFLTCLLTHLYLMLRVDKGNISVKIPVMCTVTVPITFVVSNSKNTGNVYRHRTVNFCRI